jgi:malate dehydrogenase (oxaloacetate-decarboxylating)(NADP+)
MKLAATRALADLAKEDVPDSVRRAYGMEQLEFGREYLIPKPFDPRVLVREASAVAEAAIRTGVARLLLNIDEYREQLERRMGKAREVVRIMINKAQRQPAASCFPKARKIRSCAPARSWWMKRSPSPFCWATKRRSAHA